MVTPTDNAERPTFSFAELKRILAAVVGAHPSKMKPFEARLQQLQKLGLPFGTNVGRSARTRYQYWQLAEITLYLDLLDAGVAPAAIQARFAKQPFYPSGGEGIWVEQAEGGRYLALHLNALGSYRTEDPDRKGPHATDHLTRVGPDLPRLLEKAEGDGRAPSPPIIINLAARVRDLKAAAGAVAPRTIGTSVFPLGPEKWSI